MVLPLLAVFHLTLRASFGRLDDARRHLGDMDRLYLSTVETLAMAIDAKDDVTHSHVRRVQAYAVGLARALDVTDELTLKAIEAAALLHDTGKLAVPERILNKPGKLTESEFEQMKQHVDIGADILSLVEFPYPVVPIVRAHHESWDGSGYPRGLKGDGHSDRRADSVGRRLLRRADLGPPVSAQHDRRGRDRDSARARGQDVRPAWSWTRSCACTATSRSSARRAGTSRGHAAGDAVAAGRWRRRTSSRRKCRRTRPAACSRSSACRGSRRATPAWPTCSRSARACWPTSCPARPARGTCPTRARDRLVVADSVRTGGRVAARHQRRRWASG